MSIRSIIEFNHDTYPETPVEQMKWLGGMLAYFRSGDRSALPEGATFLHSRHHSDPCPLTEVKVPHAAT